GRAGRSAHGCRGTAIPSQWLPGMPGPEGAQFIHGAVERIVLQRTVHRAEVQGRPPRTVDVVLEVRPATAPLEATVLPHRPLVPDAVGLHEVLRRAEAVGVVVEGDPIMTLADAVFLRGAGMAERRPQPAAVLQVD